MRTKILFLSTALCSGLILMNSGCDKLKSKLFEAFTTGSTTYDFTIPVISTTDTKFAWGTVSEKLSIDSLIIKETKGVFSLKDVKSVTISEMKLTLTNADASNNFANFEEGWGTLSTNNGATDLAIATGLNPDVYSETWILPSIAGVNLKEYASANVFNYALAAKARRTTSKVLNAKLAVKFKIE